MGRHSSLNTCLYINNVDTCMEYRGNRNPFKGDMIQWKLVDEISLNFPELFIIGKYVKNKFKSRGSSCYFLSSRGQKIKNITKIEQKRLFLFTFLVSFVMAFLAQKLIYTINIWFNFVFGSFFEQDRLLNLFILEVYAKRWPKCARISIQKLI